MLRMLRSRDAIFSMLCWAVFAAFELKKTACQGCVPEIIHLNGSEGNFSSPNFPNGQLRRQNCTWIISVPDGHQVRLTIYVFDLITCDQDLELLEVRDGKYSLSRHIGNFCGSSAWKNWSVFSTGKNLWVKFVSRIFISYSQFNASFKAIKMNHTKCQGGWIRFGRNCLVLSSEVTNLKEADPEKSCARLHAKPLLTKHPNCQLLYRTGVGKFVIVFKTMNFILKHHEPLESCTSALLIKKDRLVYSTCHNRIYFVCTQDDRDDNLSPVVSGVYQGCSSVKIYWELPPLHVFCPNILTYELQINSSNGLSIISEPLNTYQGSVGWWLPNNRSYTLRLSAVMTSINNPVGSPWQRDVALIPSAVPDSPYIRGATHIGNDSFATIWWSKPKDHDCYIFMYTIYYRIKDGLVGPWRSINLTDVYRAFAERHYDLTLKLEVVFEIMVTAWNSEGESTKDLTKTTLVRVGEPYDNSTDKNQTVRQSSPSDSTVALTVSLAVFTAVVLVTVTVVYIVKRKRNHLVMARKNGAGLIDHWEILPEEITCLEKIGHGQFGEVHIAEMKARNGPLKDNKRLKGKGKGKARRQSKNIVAVKMLGENADSDQKKEFLKEIELMKEVGTHRNIVNMLGCCTSVEPMFLVVEYLANGDLLNYLRKRRKQILGSVKEQHKTSTSHYCDNPEGVSVPQPRYSNSSQGRAGDRDAQVSAEKEKSDAQEMPGKNGGGKLGIKRIPTARYCNALSDVTDVSVEEGVASTDLLSFSWQIVKGMEYLSGKGFVHRDLAARNILVGNNKQVKVADFGLSRQVQEERIYHCSKHKKLPIKWMAPEAIYDQVFTAQSDVWAYGILLWEIATLGGTPYPTITNTELIKVLKRGYRMEKPSMCSDEMYELMTSCWNDEAAKRPTFTQLRETLELMLQKDVSYLDLTQEDEQPGSYYNVPQSSSDDTADTTE